MNNDMVTYSSIRNRVYPRRFPHEEAMLRYKQGEKPAAIAASYDVSLTAVWRVVDPKTRARMTVTTKKATMQGVCSDCGRKGIAMKAKRCVACSGKSRASSVRPDTLFCSSCQKWLPDEAFGERSSAKFEVRRGRSNQCRKCGSVARTNYRDRHRVPCQGGCGRMVEGKGRTEKSGKNRLFLCRRCGTAGIPFLPLLGQKGVST